MSNKFDPTNYAKHNPILVYSSDWIKSTVQYRSSLLLIKWTSANKLSINSSDLALIEQNITTQLGSIAPKTYQVKVYDKEYIQFLTVFADAPYSLKFKNPDATIRSKVEIWEYNDPVSYTTQSNNIDPMSGQSNPSGTDPNLLAAMAAVVTSSQAAATASAATTAAVAASDENLLTYDTLVSEFLLPNTTVFNSANNQNRVLAADPKCREIIIANNNAAGSIKLTTEAPADNTTYAAIVGMGNPIAPGGSFVISDPTCRDAIYAVGSTNGMKLSVTKSVKTP